MSFPDDLEKHSRTIITGEGGKSPSRFDAVKLKSINNYYFQKKSASEIFQIIYNKYKKFDQEKVTSCIEIFKSR